MRTPIAIALIAATAVVASTASVSATRLITGAEIKDGTVASVDVQDHSLRQRDLAFDPELMHKMHSNHAAKGIRQGRDEGGYMRFSPDGSWVTVDTLYGIPAGTYFVEASLSIKYNMAAAIDAICGFQASSGATSVQGSQELTLNFVSNKTNQYQTFPMSPMVILTMPQDGTIDLVCRNTLTGASNPVALNTYFYATPISTYDHT